MFSAAIEQGKADSIPRYAQPTWEELTEREPTEGRCYNCTHKTAVILDGRTYLLCVQERDYRKDGEVYECDPDETDCADWDWDGYEL